MVGQTHEVRKVEFVSEGALCRGRLYLPIAPVPVPCVVMAHGFSATMDWIVPDFAARFAEAGIAALTFDYRYLGESEGQPRQLINTKAQLTDLQRAVDFARARPEVDANRIALWGTSLGGSHVVTMASNDPSIRAVVANAPALDVWRGSNIRHEMAERGLGWGQVVGATVRLLGRALYDALRGLLRLSPHYIQVYGTMDRAVFSDPTLAAQFRALEAGSANWQNRVTPRFLFKAPRYREGTMERIHVPLLVTLARDDTELSSEFVAQRATLAPRSEVKVYAAGHFDMYHGSTFEEVSTAHVEFLRRHLLQVARDSERSDP